MSLCQICTNLQGRIDGLAKRVEHSRPDTLGDDIRRRAYQKLLTTTFEHTLATGHEIEAVSVIIAFGKRMISSYDQR